DADVDVAVVDGRRRPVEVVADRRGRNRDHGPPDNRAGSGVERIQVAVSSRYVDGEWAAAWRRLHGRGRDNAERPARQGRLVAEVVVPEDLASVFVERVEDAGVGADIDDSVDHRRARLKP